jgi:hypothetical protein
MRIISIIIFLIFLSACCGDFNKPCSCRLCKAERAGNPIKPNKLGILIILGLHFIILVILPIIAMTSKKPKTPKGYIHFDATRGL